MNKCYSLTLYTNLLYFDLYFTELFIVGFIARNSSCNTLRVIHYYYLAHLLTNFNTFPKYSIFNFHIVIDIMYSHFEDPLRPGRIFSVFSGSFARSIFAPKLPSFFDILDNCLLGSKESETSFSLPTSD